MKFPVLKIDTINNKYLINDVELKSIKNLSINLSGDNPLGLVRIEFFSDIIVTGELIHDETFKKKIDATLKNDI